ncbi:MAG: hypothetical protein K2Y22_14640 [Candidatus Obscuribacterales bacterium]|nr:hypothetical protein [Candidatus Obscuribacterales bacterium]
MPNEEDCELVLATVTTLDESETARVEALVKDRTHITTEAFVWGEFTKSDIAELLKQDGLVTVHDVPALSVPVEKDVYDATTGKEIYVIGLRGPWLWGDELEELGVTAMEKVGDTEYRVSMPGPNVASVASLYFVYKIEQKTLNARDFH